MPTRRLTLTVLAVSMTLNGACAWLPRPSAPKPAPILLTVSETVRQPCRMPLLPASPTQGDVDALIIQSGLAIIECDARRQLAVDILDAQQTAIKEAP
jgi:hypothetical protein